MILILKTPTIMPNLKVGECRNFTECYNIREYMLIYQFKEIHSFSKVFVVCITCFGELKEASSSSLQLAPLTHEASLNTKKLKRACIERF